jgi:hypothetical protein
MREKISLGLVYVFRHRDGGEEISQSKLIFLRGFEI